MKNRKIILILGNLLIIFVLISSVVFSYDDKTTHPALTDEIVDFYNLSFPDKQLTSQQKEWIVEGSILEDTAPRWINHFYDPIYKVGWTGEKAGNISPATMISLATAGFLPENPVSAVEWINNNLIQQRYLLYNGDRTWKKGLEYYANGNKEEAYKTLGYVLHLLEDQSVPDHTRNDTHAHELEKITGDYGSPYEEYLKQYDRQKIKELNIAQNLKNENKIIPQKSSIEDYLISLAEYSNKYFFSKDTINDSKYQNPKIIRDDGDFGYGKDENGKEFILARVWFIKNNNEIIKSFILDKSDNNIVEQYFSRLSRQAVIHGAGTINLFHKQAEDAVVNKEYPAHLVQYDVSGFTMPAFSVVGTLYKVGSFFTSIGDYIFGIFSDNQDFQAVNGVILDQTIETQTQNTSQQIKTSQQTIKQCSFNTFQSPSRQKFIINEVAWMGSVNSADDEWIELKNISGSEANLNGYQLVDQSEQIKVVFGSGDKISSNGFYLLERTDDDSAPNVKADKIYSGSLSNSNEGLRLFDSNCGLIDETLANPNWPAGDNDSKKTMERSSDLNWHTSGVVGGTPKKENSQPIVEQQKIQQQVQEEADNEVVLLPEIQPEIQQPNQQVQRAVFKQCVFDTTQSPSRQGVLINEVAWMGGSDIFGLTANDEWIELKNISSAEININGWQLIDKAEQIKITFEGTNKILANNFYLLERTDDGSVPNVSADLIYSNTLNNSDEGLRLFDNQCNLIDEVLANPNWPAGDNDQKRTMERSPDLLWHTYNGIAQDSIFGTPKKENSAPSFIASGGASFNNQQVITDNQQNQETQNQQPLGKILISEIMAGSEDNSDNEFVELYNSGSEVADLTGWSLKKKSSSGAEYNLVSATAFSGVIQAKSFFLIGSSNYVGAKSKDLSYSNNSNPLAYSNNSAVLYNKDGVAVDEADWTEIPKSQSLERKALVGNNCVSAQGDNEFSGNGCDTDSATDFEVRNAPNPQNSQSLPEPRSSASIQNFAVNYSSSTMELIFDWQPVSDIFGSTSTIVYEIQEYNSPGTMIFNGTSTEFRKGISEVGRDYNFSIQAFDQEGMGSTMATSTISVPSFLSNLYFYADPLSATTTLIDVSYNQYPFIPDLYQSEEIKNTFWKILVFYLNSEPADFDIYGSLIAPQNRWPEDVLDKILKIQYENCSGVAPHNQMAVLADIPDKCGLGGGMKNTSMLFGLATEDNRFRVKVIGAGDNQSFRGLNLTPDDYLTVAYYSFLNSSRWSGGTDNFRLAAIDKTKYYFGNAPNYQPPTSPDTQLSFDNSAGQLNLSFSASTDSDSLDNLIRYQFNYTTSSEAIFDENNWHSLGFNRTAVFEPVYNNDYFVGVRAEDEFGNVSAVASSSWFFPSNFTIIQQQIRAENEFNSNAQAVAQVFKPAQSGYAKSIWIFNQQFFNGATGIVQVFLYDADNPNGASDDNLLASSEQQSVSSYDPPEHQIRKRNFTFDNQPFLEAEHPYIWITTFTGASSNLMGTNNVDGVGGSGWARFSGDAWHLGGSYAAANNYYFVLIGSISP